MLSIKDFLKADMTTISNLLLTNYKKIGLSDQEFLFYIQLLKCSQEGNYFPDLNLVSEVMTTPVEDLYRLLQGLNDKGAISIETLMNQQGQTEDRYDLTLIYDKLANYLEQQQEKEVQIKSENKVTTLFQTFEIEFGRPLSPIEYETIQSWLNQDKYEVELIELALREAVLNQAYSLKYIDRILLSWERKNLKSKQQVQQDQKKRLSQIDAQNESNNKEEELPFVPLHNWLNPNQS
ncbi:MULTISPECIES: DnaD domain protein [Vagococcus]|uniref:Chromosome replication initiation protein DnaD n=1 Tax=Vagococcus fluvialis bH819 TaxID=1255619 RepID=A0A1X6WS68_9ENTE|nr:MULTISPECIES: DnaD domain protein [Vagococcus]SLM87134.1 Chromosome replication initiation protein DnaD [Vagococcus fluvialis bH819]HCM90053.1 DnaD domain protein [Vagococcus sp.]